jgi:hypothetical protein
MLLAPGEIAEIDIKKLLIDTIALIAQLEEQWAHDSKLEMSNPCAASKRRK